MTALLTYVEASLPGPSDRRHALAARHGLALEIEDWGDVDIDRYRASGVPITTVQACRLKVDPPTAPGRRERRRALEHIEEAIELADRLGARRALTVAAYGDVTADRPFERALDLFDRAARRARAFGVRILIEPLSPTRSPIFHDPNEVVELISMLGQSEEFGLAVDTGHLLDGELDPTEVLDAIELPIHELQLRGPEGAPPNPESAIEEWLPALENRPEVLAVEHREPIEVEAFEELVRTLSATCR